MRRIGTLLSILLLFIFVVYLAQALGLLDAIQPKSPAIGSEDRAKDCVYEDGEIVC